MTKGAQSVRKGRGASPAVKQSLIPSAPAANTLAHHQHYPNSAPSSSHNANQSSSSSSSSSSSLVRRVLGPIGALVVLIVIYLSMLDRGASRSTPAGLQQRSDTAEGSSGASAAEDLMGLDAVDVIHKEQRSGVDSPLSKEQRQSKAPPQAPPLVSTVATAAPPPTHQHRVKSVAFREGGGEGKWASDIEEEEDAARRGGGSPPRDLSPPSLLLDENNGSSIHSVADGSDDFDEAAGDVFGGRSVIGDGDDDAQSIVGPAAAALKKVFGFFLNDDAPPQPPSKERAGAPLSAGEDADDPVIGDADLVNGRSAAKEGGAEQDHKRLAVPRRPHDDGVVGTDGKTSDSPSIDPKLSQAAITEDQRQPSPADGGGPTQVSVDSSPSTSPLMTSAPAPTAEAEDDGSISAVYNTSLLGSTLIYPRPRDLLIGLFVTSGFRDSQRQMRQRGNAEEEDGAPRVRIDSRESVNAEKLFASLNYLGANASAQLGQHEAVAVGDGSVVGRGLIGTAEEVLVGAHALPEATWMADRCATHTGYGGEGGGGEGTAAPSVPLSDLSENNVTALLLSRLPLPMQRAIARQNYYYRYLRDEVFALDTKSGTWRIQTDDEKRRREEGDRQQQNKEEGEPSEAKGGGEPSLGERGVITGAWQSFIKTHKAHLYTASKPTADPSRPMPPPAPQTKRAAQTPVTHWEDFAAAETAWYTPMLKNASESGSEAASTAKSSEYRSALNTGMCPATRAVPFPITTPLLVERLTNKRLLFLGDSLIRNTFVATIARLCNYANSGSCMARMPTYEYDIDKKESHQKGPIGCVPQYGAKYAARRSSEEEDASHGGNSEESGNNNGEKRAGAEGEDPSESALALHLKEALNRALEQLQGTDKLAVRARKVFGAGKGSLSGGTSSREGEGDDSGDVVAGASEHGSSTRRKGAEEKDGASMSDIQKELNDAFKLAPCYRHAEFFFMAIHRLTVKGLSKDSNTRRQLSKGDLIPPTINVVFPQLNLTMSYVSVVKPKMIYAVANHLASLNRAAASDAAAIFKGNEKVMTQLPVRYLGGGLGAGPDDGGVPDALRRGYSTPSMGHRYGLLSNLDAILVSIGPHLKIPDLIASAHSYPDALSHLKTASNAAMVVAEYTHMLNMWPQFAFHIDKVVEAIKIRLALMQPDPPMFIPQRFITQFGYRLRDAGNVSVEDFNRPRNSDVLQRTVFSPRGAVYGPLSALKRTQKTAAAAGTGTDDGPIDPTSLTENDRAEAFYNDAIAKEGGTLTGIAGCGFYDNQHPAMRCHMVMSELILGGLLTKLASREMAVEEAVKAAMR